MRIVIYGNPGDGAAFSAMGQIRAICTKLHVTAIVQMITDEHMQRANGVTSLPSIEIEGSLVSVGYMPSRSEIERTIRIKQSQN